MSFPPTTHSVLPLVALRGVGKSFASGTHALAGLDLEIRPGEFLSLLGPSGCGKSTALRIIAGLSAPSQGVIEWPAAAGKSGKSQCAKDETCREMQNALQPSLRIQRWSASDARSNKGIGCPRTHEIGRAHV